MAKEAEFRALSEEERTLIKTLLSLEFPGSKELLAQLPVLLARRVDEDGSLLFSVRSSSSTLAGMRGGVAVEGSYPEDAPATENAIRVNALLHVREGKLWMLEIYKDDSSPLAGPIDPKKLVLFSPLVRAVRDRSAG